MTPMRRGFLKYYILKLLSEEERTGYGLMKAIEEETGFWKPSTGSMYPLLQALEEQGLIIQRGEGERKVYCLSERGRRALAEAHQAKAEILEGLQRAYEVFTRIFGEDEAEDLKTQMAAGSPAEDPLHRLKQIPKSLRPRLYLLHQMFLNLPYERLSKEQIAQLGEILEGALTRLGELIEE